MDLHFEGSDDRSRAALELMIPEGWDVYGKPSEDALGALVQATVAAGVTLTVQPSLVGGFLRPTALLPAS